MASASKKRARTISRVASQIYFLFILFQIPLFRFPCRIGTCSSPVEVTSSQLIASEVLPPMVVKALLYPGAITKAIINHKPIPSYNKLLKGGKFSNLRKGSSNIDLKHFEVLAGCYFSIAGAVLGLMRPGRMSLFGLLLILCGVGREALFGSKQVGIYSAMYIALLLAFFGIRRDSLNYPIHARGCVSRQRSLKSVRSGSVLALRSSSIIPKTEESGNPIDLRKSTHSNDFPVNGNSGGSLLTQGNSVGVIGGVSIVSTMNFVNKLVKWSSKEDEENCSIPFVLCSDPMLSKELQLYERSSFPFPTSKRAEHIPRDHSSIVSNLRKKRVFLENSGAGCIVMPCHVSHSWYDEITEGCSVPVLHVGECVARELKEANLKPVEAGSPPRIGLLASDATLAAGFYQEKLQNQGFEVVQPDKATMEHTVLPAMEALSRKDIEGAQNLLRIALQVLLVRAVNTIILASDDLQNLLPPDDPLLKRCLDPTDALARSAIQHSISDKTEM
ncbi:OLC1v1037490C1 [Oldenlandia corymbosa var. corymbosa]|uniref:OLC1v1037490C1 n=1 Tax=Oldenlandia corymbosa var. corymbosa TaxID=529605 RepID=A0AAV1E268_OLDCO|nr:OLC1v1037490C1 [Oldenlandia corymbosa var. corymbosa]